MRMPSVKNLVTVLGVTAEVARLVRAIGHATDNSEELARLVEAHAESTAKYVRSMFSSPTDCGPVLCTAV